MTANTTAGPATNAIPVPSEVVALLRLPVSVEAFEDLVTGLRTAYREHDLIIRTDLTTTDGWLAIALPDNGPAA
jgi:hypothetical protein